jgi:hypothetical protein
MPEPNHWFVSYTLVSDRTARRRSRVTKTFDTEVHAKEFAMEIGVDSTRLIAGTINPHSPKRLVSPTEISTWIASINASAGNCDRAE